MDVMELEAIVKNIDRRLSRVEQILPSLATKDDLREESERTRQHFNAVAERLESHIRLIAEGHVALQERIEEIDQQFGRAIAALDQRVLRLEAR
jgi:exonuclease VII small subunit